MLECHQIICVNACAYQRISLSCTHVCWPVRGVYDESLRQGWACRFWMLWNLLHCILLLFSIKREAQLEDVLCRKHADSCTRKRRRLLSWLLWHQVHTLLDSQKTRRTLVCVHACPLLLYCLCLTVVGEKKNVQFGQLHCRAKKLKLWLFVMSARLCLFLSSVIFLCFSMKAATISSTLKAGIWRGFFKLESPLDCVRFLLCWLH